MKEGLIIWDGERPNIMYTDGTFYSGLHCGDTFEAYTQDDWRSVRIELRDDGTWYLSGIDNGDMIRWMTIRI